MKKGLLLVVVMVFMVTAISAAFAGPFSDVPKKHWAYEAVNSLAAKGLLEGYADGKFKGSKAMTRYEMALLTARLIDKKFGGADLETLQKLTIEFADELALLGVKVQALEEEVKVIRNDVDTLKTDVDTLKKSGFNKFRVTLEDRVRFEENKYKGFNSTLNNLAGAAGVNYENANSSRFYNRLRMNIKGQVDDNVSMFVSLQDTTRHGVATQANPVNGVAPAGDGTARTLFLGYVDINKFGGSNLIDNFRMGRFTLTLGKGFIIDSEVDGLMVKKNYRGTNIALGAFDARNAGSRVNTDIGNTGGYVANNNSNNDGLNAKLLTADHAWKHVAAGLYYYTENGLRYSSNGLKIDAAKINGFRGVLPGSQFNDRTLMMPGVTIDGKLGKHVVAFLEYADQTIKDKNYFALGYNQNAAGTADDPNNPLSWKGKAFKLGAEWTITNRWDLTGLYQQREKDFQVIALNDDYSDSAFYGNTPYSNAYNKNAGIINNDFYNNSKITSFIVGYKATNKLHMDLWFEQLKGKDGVTTLITNPLRAAGTAAAFARGTGNFDQDAIQLVGTYQYRENTAFKLRYKTVKYKSGDSDYQALGNGAPANHDQVRLDLNVKF